MRVPLLTAHDATGHVHLVLGSNAIAAQRCQRSLAAGASPIAIFASGGNVHHVVQDLIASGAVSHLDRAFDDSDLLCLGREEIDHVVDAVFITSGRTSPRNTHISALCKRQRIPVNVTDSSSLCTFTLPALHSDGPLQVAVSTSGMGCKLAARVRRHVYSSLPPNLGQGVARLGALRRRLQAADRQYVEADGYESDDDDAAGQTSSFNAAPDPTEAATVRRMRYLAQVCEHWPLARLAAISDAEVDALESEYVSAISPMPHAPPPSVRKPRIILAGAGPGHPSLLTLATHAALKSADLILADKLVPAQVLALIPRRTPVRIAEKFPGNADAAQNAFLKAGLEGLQHGLSVLRLKQGDPYVYGRGGEEVAFFREHGYEPVVLPGVTSALVAPLAAGVPVTHRGVADEVRVCTGVGRKGKKTEAPPYKPGVTWIFLMVLNRLADFTESLTGQVANGVNGTHTNGVAEKMAENGETVITNGTTPAVNGTSPLFPLDTPCAIVERATCRDQRIVRTTLRHVVAAFEEVGSRPPGLLIVGTACSVLNDLNGKPWLIEEGYGVLDEMLGEKVTELIDGGDGLCVVEGVADRFGPVDGIIDKPGLVNGVADMPVTVDGVF